LGGSPALPRIESKLLFGSGVETLLAAFSGSVIEGGTGRASKPINIEARWFESGVDRGLMTASPEGIEFSLGVPAASPAAAWCWYDMY